MDADALSSLARVAGALLVLLLGTVLIGAPAAALYALVRELRRNPLFLDPIDVPRDLEARGYSPGVVAERILEALGAMRPGARDAIETPGGVGGSAIAVDLDRPKEVSLQSGGRGLHRLLRLPETHVGGEITCEADGYELTLRRREASGVSVLGVHRSADLGELLAFGAEDILRAIDPWALAQHYFAQESRDAASEFPRTLAALEQLLQFSAAAERPWALNLQGICLAHRRRLEEAIDCFARAAAAGPELAFIHRNWADALDRMDRFDEARGHRLRALEIPARNAGVVAGNAIGASRLHRHRQALALARRALRLAPDSARAWNAWGYALYGRHRFAQAATACERARTLGAQDAAAPSPAAMVYAALERPERALAAALEATESAGETAETLKGMGFARLSAGDARGAIRNFEAALGLAPGAGDAAYGRADALLVLGEPELALAFYERAVAIDPFYPQAHAGWARALRALGRIEESPARFAVAVRVDPAYGPAYRAWGETLSALGREDEARPLIDRAAAVERRNGAPLPLRQIAVHAHGLR
jgi:tetratricopeptide (TPR) repeat protein